MGLMAASSSSLIAYASPRESYSWRYDVFLSFRGEDTRNNFTSHLFAALRNNGFLTFHDSLLPRGQEIAPKLLEAIEQSQLSIVVFSKNYADSRWCLDELVKINDCRRRSRSRCKVVPVFLDVEPSDVRKQEGCYKQAFLRHCSARRKFTKERIDRWRKALFETGNLSGHHLQNHANGDEEKFVCQIVKEVALILKRPHLHVANHPVGIQSRVGEVCSLLDANAATQNGVGIVVIGGIGGIGKTTIAKATFNFLAPHFEGCSFLADVRSTFGQGDGSVKLQKQLISDLKNTQDVAIHNYHQGTEEIKRTIRNRRVLLVVDDVDSSEQLEMLAINRENLLSGSRVLVTTRHSSCVVIRGNVSVYEPRGLTENESIQLFKMCVDGIEDHDIERYQNLMEQINGLAGGIPLVLEVWASYFRSSKVENWPFVLRKLKKVPPNEIQAKLRISYDSLDDIQKKLFLDIACFFIGMRKEFVIAVLKDEASGWFPQHEIEMLISRCLVCLHYRAGGLVIMMHDVIRDMGREIVRQESLENPEKRTRLWDRHDVLRILEDCSGTNAVESIILDNSDSDDVSVSTEAFKNMQNLRLLRFKNVQISGTYNGEISFKKLKCLVWHGFPLKCLPTNLNVSNLVVLKLNYSRLKQLWEGTKRMNKLRFLDVSHSIFLIKTPNFSGMRSLEVLRLHNCTNLKEVDESVLCLDKLVLLDLSNCKNLRKFPVQSVLKLGKLEELNFSGCSKLFSRERTPSHLLSASTRLSCMTVLDISYCNLSHVPCEIGSLESLIYLKLEGNRFSSLPDTVSNMQELRSLHLNSCVNLHSIPDLPRNLWEISARGCSSLTNLPLSMSDLQSLERLSLQHCVALKSIPHLPKNLWTLSARGCLSLETPPVATSAIKLWEMTFPIPISDHDKYNHAFRRFIAGSYQAAGDIRTFECTLNGTEVPSWFNYKGGGERIQFVVPREVRGWIFCVIGPPHQHDLCPIVHVFNRSFHPEPYTIGASMIFYICGKSSLRMWVRCEPLPRSKIGMDRGDDVEIVFKLRCGRCKESLAVEKCGVCLIYEDEEIEDQWMEEDIINMDSQPPPHYEDPGPSDDVSALVGNDFKDQKQFGPCHVCFER